MNRLGAVLIAMATASTVAHAAEITRIASSFEDDKPFGLYLDLSFEHSQERGKISRAHYQGGTLAEVSELRYSGTDSRFQVDAHVGLWKDLEFSFGVPIVFAKNESWNYVSGTDATNSTIANNCLAANGSLLNAACPSTGAGATPMFGVPNNTYRGGLGNLEFGLAYAFFNQKKDDTKPTWIVGLDYEAPTAEKLDPTIPTSNDDRGKIGDRVHKYTLYTTFSRNLGKVEPYFKAAFMIPVRGPQWYSNCDHPSSANMSHPENCGQGPWTRAETGITVPNTLDLVYGAEFVPFSEADGKRVTLDLRGEANFIGAGRYYNELSGLFGKLMHSDSYGQFGGQLGITAQATEFITFKFAGTLLYNTEHGLASESEGQDLNGNGKIDFASNPLEVNPNFDFRSDLSTRTFRISESTDFDIKLTVSFNF